MPTVSDLRQGIADLAVLADADLAVLWRQITTADEAREALLDVLPALVDTYGSAAAALAADWYDELRDEVRPAGRFTAIPVALEDTGADVLARWGIKPLFAAEPDWDAARSLVAGGLQRRIANASRYTVAGSAVVDPGAAGWQRVGDGSSCAFCRLLISRGAVYEEATAQFASHDHCGCQAAPAWRGEPVPVKPFTPSTRGTTAADRARARAYMRDAL